MSNLIIYFNCMAILKSPQGKRKGRVGELVYSVYRGVQIEKSAPASVANPQTDKQVAQRAKMKLITQIAAVMAPVIAFRAEGTISARNKFVSSNFGQLFYSGDKASVILENLQLADGNAGLPAIIADRTDTTKLVVSLSSAPSEEVVSVVYAVFRKSETGALELFATRNVTDAGEGGVFSVDLRYTADEIVIYAFGVLATSSAARAVYYNFAVAAGSDIASLLNEINYNGAALKYSKTRGVTMQVGTTQVEGLEPNQVRVFATAGDGGSVTGGGVYTIGQQVTLVATPGTSYNFVGWRPAGGGEYVSTSATYTFTAQNMVDLIAIFEYHSFDSGD